MNEMPKDLIRTGSVAKRFLFGFSMAICLLFATATAHYLIQERTERIERETREMLNIQLGKAAIDRDLQDVISDLTFLARHNETTDLFQTDNPGARASLAKQFRVFSKQKGKYDQIRILNDAGREIVRVNYNHGNPVVANESALQNKSDRYYFGKTWELKAGNVYISPFDLNVEHGEIEIPEVPMIRFGTLMLDKNGNKNGVLLLNYLGSSLIDDFKEATANIADHVMLINSDGFWLSAPGRKNEWGFMYGLDNTLAKRFPDAWRRFNAEEKGQFYNSHGLFTFTTIYPVSNSIGNHVATGLSQPVDKTYYWKTVSRVAPPKLLATLSDFLRQNLLLYMVMLLLLATTFIVIAQTRFSHRQAVREFESERRFRELLEHRVQERTHELKKTQEEKNLVVQHLIQAEKMTAIGTMASGIGHEINNPLYAILGLAEAIRDDDDPDQAQEHAGKILGYTRNIAEIVKNLTGYARPFIGEEYKPANVNKCIRKAVSTAERTLLGDRIEIKTDLADLPRISAYSEEIHQVFFNIIRNAIQSMDEVGELYISSRFDGTNIIIRVEDNGEGITPENLGKIFDPFFTTRDPDKGEGMGLYVVHQIVQKYKGSISITSVVGKGSTCMIEFPESLQDQENDK